MYTMVMASFLWKELVCFFNPWLKDTLLSDQTNKDHRRCICGKIFPDLENHDNQQAQERKSWFRGRKLGTLFRERKGQPIIQINTIQ